MHSDQLKGFEQAMLKFVWPMQIVEDIFTKLNGAKYFSTLDLHTGYHYVPLDVDSISKIAFTSPL